MRGFLSFLLEFLVPSVCLVCGRELRPFEAANAPLPGPPWPERAREFLSAEFSFEALGGVTIPASILCPRCWLSLAPAKGAGSLSRPAAEPVPVVSPFLTNETLLAIIRFLKFSGGRSAVAPLGWWMAEALRDHCPGAAERASSKPLLVPVPLHPSREKSRGYNQAALLAWHVAERLGLEVESRLLRRTKNTKSQSKLDAEARAENVREAFDLLEGGPVEGRHVMLVDDVVTTGATVGACVEALAQASPASIAILSAGRSADVFS